MTNARPTQEPATTPAPSGAFTSFWMGGFEGADHVNSHGQPLDMVRASGHLARLDEDLGNAAALGLRSVRESIGWRLTETAPGRYDFTRLHELARAARRRGVQVQWTLMHYGTPPGVSLFDDRLIDRFAAFAAACASELAPLSDTAPVYTLVNEIGFLSWAASQTNLIHPYRGDPSGRGGHTVESGFAVKRRLVQATLAGIDAIRQVDPRARFLHVEPLVHVAAPRQRPDLKGLAAKVASYQWQAWDMIAGRLEPELGGHPQALDLIGTNHYHSGQWEVGTERRLWWHLRDPRRKPFSQLLQACWQRYRRPMTVAETSHIGDGRRAWLDEIAAEVQRAIAAGTPVEGLCLYPLVDRPDWDNPGHWHHSGLYDVVNTGPEPGQVERVLHTDYAAAIQRWQTVLPPPGPARPARADGVPAVREAARPGLSAQPARPARPALAASPAAASAATALPVLLVFSHRRWDFVYHRPQQLMSRLARHWRVLFVEAPVRCEGAGWIDVAPQGPHLDVLRPHTPARAGFHDAQAAALQPLLARYLRDEGIADVVAWLYTPMAWPALRGLPVRGIVYDCMDDLSHEGSERRQLAAGAKAEVRSVERRTVRRLPSTLDGTPRLWRQHEQSLLAGADLVFTGGPALYQAKQGLHPSVHCMPSAVDAEHFSPSGLRADSVEAHAARALQAGIPGPRLGYFGVIDERLDLELLAALADARPDWQIVMVGPAVRPASARLPQRPNIHWLGLQTYAVLPHLLADWDLCLLPFAMSDGTRYLCPTKALEYMAGEKPIVSTRVPSVVSLYGDVVHLADNAKGFVQACETALGEAGDKRSRRIADMLGTAWRLSWDATADSMQKLLTTLPAALRSPSSKDHDEAARPGELAEHPAAVGLR